MPLATSPRRGPPRCGCSVRRDCRCRAQPAPYISRAAPAPPPRATAAMPPPRRRRHRAIKRTRPRAGRSRSGRRAPPPGKARQQIERLFRAGAADDMPRLVLRLAQRHQDGRIVDPRHDRIEQRAQRLERIVRQRLEQRVERHGAASLRDRRPQCISRSGSGVVASAVRVAPPNSSSRHGAWP
jgi:hypothetical protein